MLDPHSLFPDLDVGLSEVLEQAPASLLAVAAGIDFTSALSAADPRYVQTTAARGENFQSKFLKTLGYDAASGGLELPADAGKHVLLFGHVGCGKSTELLKLCDTLEQPTAYWVVKVDLLKLIDPNDARYCDVWLAAAEQLVEALKRDALSIAPVVLNRLRNWFTEQVLTHEQVKELQAELKTEAEASVSIPLLAKLLARFTSSLRTGSTYRKSLREVVRNTYGEFAGALNQLIAAANDAVRAAGKGKQVLFAIDGTDRFQGEDWKRFFVEDVNQLTLIRCVAVYTAPLALKTSGDRLDYFDALTLPMVKLKDFEKQQARPEAYDALRRLVLSRCHYSLFDAVPTLDKLIDYSGGHLRDLLQLLKHACIEADGARLDAAAVDKGAARLATDFRDWLRKEHYPVLVDCALNPHNTGTSDDIIFLVDRGALLEYNTGSWRQPHPVIRLLKGYREVEQSKAGPLFFDPVAR